jgi:hypothetical protein
VLWPRIPETAKVMPGRSVRSRVRVRAARVRVGARVNVRVRRSRAEPRGGGPHPHPRPHTPPRHDLRGLGDPRPQHEDDAPLLCAAGGPTNKIRPCRRIPAFVPYDECKSLPKPIPTFGSVARCGPLTSLRRASADPQLPLLTPLSHLYHTSSHLYSHLCVHRSSTSSTRCRSSSALSRARATACRTTFRRRTSSATLLRSSSRRSSARVAEAGLDLRWLLSDAASLCLLACWLLIADVDVDSHFCRITQAGGSCFACARTYA